VFGERERAAYIVDLARRDSGPHQVGDPRFNFAPAKRLLERLAKLRAVTDAVSVRREALVTGEFRPADDLTEGRKLPIVPHSKYQLAFESVEELVGGDARVSVPKPCFYNARQGESAGLIDKCREERREQIDLDALSATSAFAVPHRGQNPDRSEEPADNIYNRNTNFLGLTVWVTSDAHQTAERLNQQVVSGPARTFSRAEARDRAVDQTRMLRLQGLVVEAEAPHNPWAEVLDEHVRPRDDFSGPGEPSRRSEI
jgi:hypothetical protein